MRLLPTLRIVIYCGLFLVTSCGNDDDSLPRDLTIHVVGSYLDDSGGLETQILIERTTNDRIGGSIIQSPFVHYNFIGEMTTETGFLVSPFTLAGNEYTGSGFINEDHTQITIRLNFLNPSSTSIYRGVKQ